MDSWVVGQLSFWYTVYEVRVFVTKDDDAAGRVRARHIIFFPRTIQ